MLVSRVVHSVGVTRCRAMGLELLSSESATHAATHWPTFSDGVQVDSGQPSQRVMFCEYYVWRFKPSHLL
jgi:peptide methionine sulfoxide reductase MsrB